MAFSYPSRMQNGHRHMTPIFLYSDVVVKNTMTLMCVGPCIIVITDEFKTN